MIAKAKSISHGIRAMLYVSGESRNKKHPEKITRICDNFIPQGMDASGIWTEMKFVTMDRPDINNDHAIHIRAHRAAEKIALQREWITAKHIHESRIPQVSEDCMEALRELDEWSWEGYAEKLAAKGYELYLRKDEEKVVRGYVLHKGSSRFKGSELGKGRNLTASRIERTWEKLHPEQTKQESPTPKQPVITAPKPFVHNEAGQKPQTDAGRNNLVYEYYTEWQPDRLRTEFEHDGKNYNRYIPEKVLDCLNDEFDFRELANWQALQNLAIAFFTLVASPYGRFPAAVEAARSPTSNGDATRKRTRSTSCVVVRERLRTGSACK